MARKKSTAVNEISAKEIKAWLRGIQEFQPKNWTPSPEQWNTIREKIFNLIESDTDMAAMSNVKAPREAVQAAPYYASPGYDNYTPPTVPVVSVLNDGMSLDSTSGQDGEYQSSFR